MRFAPLLLACLLFSSRVSAQAIGEIWRVGSDPKTGASAAVIAPDVPLIHTTQLMYGEGAPRGSTGIDSLLYDLSRMLGSAGGLKAVVKLNIYADDEEVAAQVLRDLPRSFPDESLPAVSLVVTRLPGHGKRVALDAVAVSRHPAKEVENPSGLSATLPPGCRLYISGQAEPGATLKEATRKTLHSIAATLEHCGRSTQDIVQLKCFWQSTGSVAEAQDEIARYFIGKEMPPVIFVEWKMAAPIEIEAIAWGGPAKPEPDEPLEFVTPPALKASPLFSRVARIHRGGTIYFGDLLGAAGTSASEQATAPFEQLKKLLGKTGSDLTHLAKATYYVTDDDASQALNAVRPKYYDPARPPAASKAVVAGTGRADVRFAMDMIAVPSSRGTPASGPERGHGLSAAQAAAGWISLFDGQTAFGWKNAKVENSMLFGGETTTRFGNCELRAIFANGGTLSIGGREHEANERPLLMSQTGEPGSIRIGRTTALRSLAVRPLGLRPLFNGRDLAGWKTIERSGPTDKPSAYFRVEQGALRAIGGPGAIEYAGGEFGDLMLQIDVRSRAVHSNGGVFLRSVAGQFMNGYEVQLHNRCLEDDPSKPFRYTTGGIDDRQDARRMVGRDFATFRMTIIMDGPHVATWVNGVQVADWTDERPLHDNPRQGQRLKPGTLQLQAHDPDTDFEVRQILAAPLPAAN